MDANVVIYSRIREEIGAGRSVEAAIQAGYSKATSAIVDGNITTLIAAVVLYIFGTGPIKGFAMTLALGIVVSMFTALVITRVIMKLFYNFGITDVKCMEELFILRSLISLASENGVLSVRQ